jgi:hypothetical protein
MRTPGQPGYGLPPREGIVDLTRDVADLKAQFGALQAVQANSLQINSVYQSVDTLTYPNDSAWHDYCLTATYEPPPWAGRLTFFLNVSAGTTFTGPGAGALAVQAGAANNGSAQSPLGVSRALNSTGAVSVDASFAGSNTFAAGVYTHLILSVFVAAAGASNTGSGNANINGVLFWSRA